LIATAPAVTAAPVTARMISSFAMPIPAAAATAALDMLNEVEAVKPW
jgi:hypothetical protein